jgi:hypothetical protein
MKSFPWLFLYFAVLFPIAMLTVLVAWHRVRRKSGPAAGENSERPATTPVMARKAG